MMENPHSESIVLPPKSDEEYELGVSFSSDVLTSAKASFDNLVQPDIKVTYKQDGEEKSAQKKLESSYVLGKGKLTWSDPEMIASYFTTQDVVVDKFARTNIQAYSEILKKYFGRTNIGRAIILYDALGTFGLVYNVDPSTPFLQISDDKSAFDTVKYPWELLDDKIGDCDDLATLYGTLLNNVGIETMWLDVFKPGEGHVFLMFDSGVDPDDVDRLFLDRNEVAVLDNKVWIPVEATLVGKPFFSAWKQGALKYSQMKADQFVNEINMTKAMAKYLPGSITPEEVYIPEPAGVSELLEEDIRQYIKWLDQVVAKGIEGKLETADDYYDVAVLYMEFGRYQSAVDNLNTAIGITPNFPDALNTLGVCYTKQEEYEKSIEFYNKALEQQKNHPGFMLNIAISEFMQGNKGLAKQKYDEVVTIAPSFAGKLEDILGSAKASIGLDISPNAISISSELEADLDSESSKGLNELKESAPQLEPEVVQRASYRARRAKSDNAVGITFAQIGNNAMAVDYFKKALDKDPDNSEYKLNLAVALYRVRKYDQALEIFEEIKLKSPEIVGQATFIESMGEKPSKYKKNLINFPQYRNIVIMIKYLILLPILSFSFILAQEEEDIDLDALWDNTVWDEIEEINEVEGEVEQVVTVAGVRGAEAEDEALHHLYYRKSMRGPNKMELQSALGKLMKTLARLEKKDENHAKIPEVRHYMIQIYYKLGDKETASIKEKELIALAPESKWAKAYQK